MWSKEKLNLNPESLSIHLWTWTTWWRWLGGFGVWSANKKLQFLIYIYFFKPVSTLCKRGVRQCCSADAEVWEGKTTLLYLRKMNPGLCPPVYHPFIILFMRVAARLQPSAPRRGARWRRPLSAGRVSNPLRECRDRDCKYSCLLWINWYLWVSGSPAEMPPVSPPAGRAVWIVCVQSFTAEISKRSWIIEGDQKLDARC